MTQEASQLAGERVRRISFWVVIGLTSLFLLLALLAAYPLLFTNWLPTDAWLAVRTDRSPGDQVHRIHSLALGVIAWGMLSGVALQFIRPKQKVAALLMALAIPVAVASAEMLIGTYTVAGTAPFLILILAACALHPSARAFIRPPRLDLPMLVLTVIAAGPWISYALGVGETARVARPGGDTEHLTFIVSVALLIPVWGLMGATGKSGWAFPAGAAVLASGCLGLQSLIFPDALSGLQPLWAWATVAWCIAYAVAARVRSRQTRSAAHVAVS